VAPLHTWGWERSDLPDWVPEPPAGYQDIQDRYAGYIEPFLARWGERLPGEVVDVVRRLADSLADVLAGLDAAPATLVHGDLHLDNVLFPDRPDAAVDGTAGSREQALVDAAFGDGRLVTALLDNQAAAALPS
jgi:hypothetical protein